MIYIYDYMVECFVCCYLCCTRVVSISNVIVCIRGRVVVWVTTVVWLATSLEFFKALFSGMR